MVEHEPAAFADLLRQARRAAGLSQEELAERSGLSARAISALERGVNRAPRRDTLQMLADALSLPDDDRRRWERLRRQEAGRPVEPTTVDARVGRHAPHNLPPQLTRFFGRNTDIETLIGLLGDRETRLVTLTGPGGTGKTRLALQVAGSLLDANPDGTYFVDLAPISDPEGVIPAIGSTLGVWPRADQPILDTVTGALDGKRLLVVLDNVEHVLAAAVDLGELLGRCPNLQMLATSRAPLRVRGEREFPVAPLPVIDAVHLSEASESDAIRLFFDRARAIRPDFDEDVDIVAQICRQLDGLPLAIELGAASLRLFPAKTIQARLEQRLPLVASSHRDAPARQRTLRDTIAWSYDLLSPEDQRLYRVLSIFKGGWMLDSAEAVVGEDRASIDVLRGTETLIEHSLIQSHEWLDGSPRFTMLETIREFGLEQLKAAGERDVVHRRLAAFLLHLNANATEQLRGPRSRDWLKRGDAEIENVRLSLDWATTHDPQLALRLAREVGWYLLTRGGFVEAQQRLDRAFTVAGDISDDLRAGALLDRAMYATTYLDFETASQDVDNALALYRQLGDEHGIAESVHAYGRIANWSDDFERAIPLFEEALARFRALDSITLTVCCANLAAALMSLGKLDAASPVLDEGLAHGERFGDIWALVLIVGSIAELERIRGSLARAREANRRTFKLLQELEDPRYIAASLVACACLAIDEVDDEQAARMLGAASALRQAIGHVPEPIDEPEYVRLAPIARSRINADRWSQAWESGRTLSQSEAIDLALNWLGTNDS